MVFTQTLLEQARATHERNRPLLYRWALWERAGADRVRAQLDTAAALVPEPQRPRVLGPLASDDDKHVLAATGVLLLAKVLHDQGWTVDTSRRSVSIPRTSAFTRGRRTSSSKPDTSWDRSAFRRGTRR